MSIISQIGVVILIAFIIVVLVRANQSLEEVAEEGEHFVNEWAEKEERREIRKEQRMQLRQKNMAALQAQEGLNENTDMSNNTVAGNVSDMSNYTNTSNDTDREYDRANDYAERMPSKEAFLSGKDSEDVKQKENPKIIPMRFPENEDLITLIELNENHKPIRRIKIDHYPYTIGRGEENDLVLDDLCVARKHAQIEVMQGRVVLKDNGTANKIFTDGGIYTQLDLVSGRNFYIGSVEFTTEVARSRASEVRRLS